ncbi:twin-arginine translocase subunit TatC [Acidianus sulfidivorans JP7]|uniref:Sec-independent protein translocase protein TatC n=1 Tax=Acidianus sulfidivorans JP7 TaxID=619593 RepID=A0A2U9IPU6_9CREN|nr:twin-arginine translocase subunit TatC [Acidianus sulfidivorans]AWR98035.1 twin-arginine translocase subunit TatC [Acidianus sulfidivorans JP7]
MVTRTEDVEKKEEERPLLDHLRELVQRLRRAFISIFVTFAILFGLSPTTIRVDGHVIPMVYPDIFHSFSTLIIVMFIHSELPPQLHLININVFDTLYSSAYIAFFFGIVISLPFIFKEIYGFIAPGLYENEKKLVRNVILPSSLLFLAGAAFAYFIIIPFMLRFILYYTQSLGVEPTLGLRSFISTVVTLMLAVGFAFEFPLVMAVLSYIGIVKPETWRKNWRWGVLGSFIIAWMISPGTTGGIIETTIGIILSSLYFAGYGVSKILVNRKLKNQQKLSMQNFNSMTKR